MMTVIKAALVRQECGHTGMHDKELSAAAPQSCPGLSNV